MSTDCGQRLWTVWTGAAPCTCAAVAPVDDAAAGALRRQTAGMPIEVVPAELYALAGVLRSAADRADRMAAQVPGEVDAGALAPALGSFTETLSAAAGCLAGELRWLGTAVAGAADSWLGLDGVLLPRRGAGVPG